MVEVTGVKFKEIGKIYYFSPGEFNIQNGDSVIVETSRGIEFGRVVIPKKQVSENEIVQPLKSVVRIATEEDKKQAEANKNKEKAAFATCLEKIQKHKLDMKLIDVEYTFDGNKILFYFTADGRVDFRELVKDLASVFRTRIELRQIGVRDEAKMLGGIGICGKFLCCSTFFGDFEPVSIKMAKEQSLSLNPTKISGNCGRLMCCLKYEQEAYEELNKITPKEESVVQTPMGRGVVAYSNILKGYVKVKLDSDDGKVLQQFDVNEIKIIKNVDVKIDEKTLKELKQLEE